MANAIHLGLTSLPKSILACRIVKVHPNGELEIQVHGKPLPLNHELWGKFKLSPLHEVGVNTFSASIVPIVSAVQQQQICKGIEKHEHARNEFSNRGSLDENLFGESRYRITFRSHGCLKLVPGLNFKRCQECNSLYGMMRQRGRCRKSSSEPLPAKLPHKFLSLAQAQERLGNISKELNKFKTANKRLKERLEAMVQANGKKPKQTDS